MNGRRAASPAFVHRSLFCLHRSLFGVLMGWEDRPYYREGRGAGNNPLLWLLYGSVHLFTAFGIRVRAHASLVVVCALILLLGAGFGFGDSMSGRVQMVTALFAVVLLHE